MDYHFVLPVEPKKTKKTLTLKNFIKNFFPIFGLAAVLPFMLFFVMNSTNLKFESSADITNEMRVWIDPPEVIAKPGEVITANVVAAVPLDKPIVYNVNATLVSDKGIIVSPTTITYNKPFNGQVVLGTIQINTLTSGKCNISLPKEKITTNQSDLDINTAGMSIYIE